MPQCDSHLLAKLDRNCALDRLGKCSAYVRMRRKGEKKVEKRWAPWGPQHPIAQNMAAGTSWLHAWLSQAATPWPAITKRADITQERLIELDRGARPTDDELQVLAQLWQCDLADLYASLPEPGPD